MTKLNSQNFSLEALDRVGEFYNQSFERLSTFYADSFSQVLWTVGAVGAVVTILVGVVAPFLVGFYQKKILEKDRSEMEQSIRKMREDLEGSIKKMREDYEKKSEENLKKIKEDFEKEKKDLEEKIWSSLVFANISIAANASSPYLSLIQAVAALKLCLNLKLKEHVFVMVIKEIKNYLLEIDAVRPLEISKLKSVISDLKDYKKDDALFQNMVDDLQSEYDKVSNRLKEKNNQK